MKYFLLLMVNAVLFFNPLFMNAFDQPLLLKNNLQRALAGDYIVTAQDKNFTVLLVRKNDGTQIHIEEITIPSMRIPKQGFSWQQWLLDGAHGNTSWVMYPVQLSTGEIHQTFSYNRNEWITIPQAQNFLSTLLSLQLQPIPDLERKKIGSPSSPDDFNRRSYWQPPLIVNGQIIRNVPFSAWRTRWPKDGGDVSGKLIEIYLPQDNDKYPSYFPYWLQISGVIGKAKIRIIDSGRLNFDLPKGNQN